MDATGRTGIREHLPLMGLRHGNRTWSLTGSFRTIQIAVPRARLKTPPGCEKRMEEPSAEGRMLAADALIASVCLSGTNARRVLRALGMLFAGAVCKDAVSEVWRKLKND